jgi:hypothetical protein
MVNATRSPGRKTHLLALVKQGDDAFSACGFAEGSCLGTRFALKVSW